MKDDSSKILNELAEKQHKIQQFESEESKAVDTSPSLSKNNDNKISYNSVPGE